MPNSKSSSNIKFITPPIKINKTHKPKSKSQALDSNNHTINTSNAMPLQKKKKMHSETKIPESNIFSCRLFFSSSLFIFSLIEKKKKNQGEKKI